jgi:hypothetical protein
MSSLHVQFRFSRSYSDYLRLNKCLVMTTDINNPYLLWILNSFIHFVFLSSNPVWKPYYNALKCKNIFGQIPQGQVDSPPRAWYQ